MELKLVILAIGLAYGWIAGMLGFGLRDPIFWLGYFAYAVPSVIAIYAL